VAEIHAGFYDVTPLNQGPIVTVLVGGLNLSQRMAEGVLAEVFKVVPGTNEVRRSEINGIAGRARYAELLRDVRLAGERTLGKPPHQWGGVEVLNDGDAQLAHFQRDCNTREWGVI